MNKVLTFLLLMASFCSSADISPKESADDSILSREFATFVAKVEKGVEEDKLIREGRKQLYFLIRFLEKKIGVQAGDISLLEPWIARKVPSTYNGPEPTFSYLSVSFEYLATLLATRRVNQSEDGNGLTESLPQFFFDDLTGSLTTVLGSQTQRNIRRNLESAYRKAKSYLPAFLGGLFTSMFGSQTQREILGSLENEYWKAKEERRVRKKLNLLHIALQSKCVKDPSLQFDHLLALCFQRTNVDKGTKATAPLTSRSIVNVTDADYPVYFSRAENQLYMDPETCLGIDLAFLYNILNQRFGVDFEAEVDSLNKRFKAIKRQQRRLSAGLRILEEMKLDIDGVRAMVRANYPLNPTDDMVTNGLISLLTSYYYSSASLEDFFAKAISDLTQKVSTFRING